MKTQWKTDVLFIKVYTTEKEISDTRISVAERQGKRI